MAQLGLKTREPPRRGGYMHKLKHYTRGAEAWGAWRLIRAQQSATHKEQTIKNQNPTWGKHTTTTEACRPEQEKQLPKPTDLPGNKHPWTRQEELQPRSKWANKPSWRDNTPLCRVGDCGNPSPQGKPAPREGSPLKPSPSPPVKRNLT